MTLAPDSSAISIDLSDSHPSVVEFKLSTSEGEMLVEVETAPADDDFGDSVPLLMSQSAEGYWVALDQLVGEFGEGPTHEEAVRDLFGTLFELRDQLRVRRFELNEAMAEKLAVLERALAGQAS